MSKMPDDIKTAINDYASGRADKPNVIKHAEFGYSLSLERIGELEKEVDRLKALIKDHMYPCDCPLCTKNWENYKKENNL